MPNAAIVTLASWPGRDCRRWLYSHELVETRRLLRLLSLQLGVLSLQRLQLHAQLLVLSEGRRDVNTRGIIELLYVTVFDNVLQKAEQPLTP